MKRFIFHMTGYIYQFQYYYETFWNSILSMAEALRKGTGSQGNSHNITDRLIAAGEHEPFLIVCNDRSVGNDEENTVFIVDYLIMTLQMLSQDR